MTLYEIESDLALLLADIEEAGGEITPEQEAALDALNLSRDDKLKNWVRYLHNLRMMEEGIQGHIDRFTKKRDTLRKLQDTSKNQLGSILGLGNKWKASDGLGDLSWRRSERIEPLMPVDQMRELFVRVIEKRELDKAIAKAQIKAGEHVPEAELVECWNLQVK